MSEAKILLLDGLKYQLEIQRKFVSPDPDPVRIIIPTYMPNQRSSDITRVCVDSVLKFTTTPYEVWLVDNHSPGVFGSWIHDYPTLNLVLSHTEPVSPQNRSWLKRRMWEWRKPGVSFQASDVSYANSIGLELGVRSIPPGTNYVFTMHSDTLALRPGWLEFLKSKLTPEVRAVGCWKDNIRVQALHIGGLLFDFQLYQRLGASFMHNIGRRRHPDREEYDVGDEITLRFHESGFETYSCPNTYNDESLIERISDEDLLWRDLHSDRCFDASGRIFYAHMGRGAPKSFGSYSKEGKTYPEQWLAAAAAVLKA